RPYRRGVGRGWEEVEVADGVDQGESRRCAETTKLVARAWGDGKDDWQSPRKDGEALHNATEEWTIDQYGPVQGYEQVLPRVHSDALGGANPPETRLYRHQAVDHGVAHEVDPIPGNPLTAKIVDRLRAADEAAGGKR